MDNIILVSIFIPENMGIDTKIVILTVLEFNLWPNILYFDGGHFKNVRKPYQNCYQ